MQTSEKNKLLMKAQMYLQNGQISAAETIYQDLVAHHDSDEELLKMLVGFYLKLRKLDEAIKYLQMLVKLKPDNMSYCHNLSDLFIGNGQHTLAIACYQNFLETHQRNAAAHFNLALIYKNCGKYDNALSHYTQALDIGITGQEEVYCNIGVIYSETHRESKAEENYLKSLSINPDYTPAQINLASLCEEKGDKKSAIYHYQKVLKKKPRSLSALLRLCHLNRIERVDSVLVASLKREIMEESNSPLDRESVFYALGKAHDDCKEYDIALNYYKEANRINSKRVIAYDKKTQRLLTEEIINKFSPNESFLNSLGEQKPPIFICGMFRSGSTLIEQILSGHSKVVSGGENEFFHRLVKNDYAGYPYKAERLNNVTRERIYNDYWKSLNCELRNGHAITDKRPDNFQYIGLIKQIFPDAKIIYTNRNKYDNLLSVYFQQLSNDYNYATDINNIAHFLEMQQRLMSHWCQVFADDILPISYDMLIRQPEVETRRMLDFCDLDWDSACLEFDKRDNHVKTASIWQVRQPLYSSSSGRWKNYSAFFQQNDFDIDKT